VTERSEYRHLVGIPKGQSWCLHYLTWATYGLPIFWMYN
jgi:hypothetical protein